MTTPILGLQELIASQTQPHVPINTALRVLEAVGQITVVGIDNDPPLSPADGDCYIIGGTPTGVWVGHETELAVLIGGGWTYLTPIGGWIAYVQDEAAFYYFDADVPEWSFIFSRGVPTTDFSADLTLASTHNGRKLVCPEGTSPPPVLTVPAYSSLALGTDHTTTIVNMNTEALTITIEEDSPPDLIYKSPEGTTADLSLAQYGVATLTKISNTEWIITGTGLT